MPESIALPRHLRPRRQKIFGRPQARSIDRNTRARIMAYAEAYSARHRQPGQHGGPLSHAFMRVLQALLYGFDGPDGCFPSYETIATRARVARSTVAEAIKALESAGMLTWVNCLRKARAWERDLLGKWVAVWRVVRSSNAYRFIDRIGREAKVSKSESRPRPGNPDSYHIAASPKHDLAALPVPLLTSLKRLGEAILERQQGETSSARTST